MNINENGTHLEDYRYWDNKLHQPYDYKHNGLIKHLVSNRIANTTNPLLRNILNIYESMCVFMMKYVDVLNNVHNYAKSNR